MCQILRLAAAVFLALAVPGQAVSQPVESRAAGPERRATPEAHDHRPHQHRSRRAHGTGVQEEGREHRHGPATQGPTAHVHRTGRRSHVNRAHEARTEEIETENLFGFTLGSDTEHAGAKAIALETVARLGKRDGSYTAIAKKLEFGYGLSDSVSLAFGVFADYHRVAGVSGLDDARTFSFNGLGAELRWRLLERGTGPLGVTLHIEPSWQTHDELTGQRAVKLGAENKLIFDAELINDRLFAALNLLHELERVRERGSAEWEKASKIGVAAAMSARLHRQIFAGVEIRYLRAYEGLLPRTFAGEALFLGPTLFARVGPKAWIAAAWNVQVAGRAAGDPGRLDLVNFERHQVRLKLGAEF